MFHFVGIIIITRTSNTKFFYFPNIDETKNFSQNSPASGKTNYQTATNNTVRRASSTNKIILLSQASILSSINKKKKKERKKLPNLSIFPGRRSHEVINMENHGRAKEERGRERERKKNTSLPTLEERNDEKRICIRVSVFKLSQCRVYMEIPRAMSPTKVPGIELNITVAQRWSSNRLPMVK